MNDSTASAPGSSLLPDGIAAITTAHLILMALVAIAAVAIIVAGMRRKRRRVKAEEQVEARAQDAGVTVATEERASEPGVSTAPEPAGVSAPPPPVTRPGPAASMPAVEPERETPDPTPPLADEPIASAAPMEASPASVAADIPAASAAVAPVSAAPLPAGDPADGPVTLLKGLGPKLADRLGSLGITTVGQLAALTDDEAEALDAQLGPFAGRMNRDRWIEQSRFLAAGDRAGFEAVFGRL